MTKRPCSDAPPPLARNPCRGCQYLEVPLDQPPCNMCNYFVNNKWAPADAPDAPEKPARDCGECDFGKRGELACRGCERHDTEPAPPMDAINPPHYRQFPIEVIQLCRHLNFNRGNAVKYLCRAGKKDDEVQDLRKARWYIEDEIQRITGEGDHAKP